MLPNKYESVPGLPRAGRLQQALRAFPYGWQTTLQRSIHVQDDSNCHIVNTFPEGKSERDKLCSRCAAHQMAFSIRATGVANSFGNGPRHSRQPSRSTRARSASSHHQPGHAPTGQSSICWHAVATTALQAATLAGCALRSIYEAHPRKAQQGPSMAPLEVGAQEKS